MKHPIYGEFELIDRLTKNFKKSSGSVVAGIGDDCAVINKNKDEYLLLTCDASVDGVHFDRDYFAPEQIGQKAIAVNASDIAAMGGVPKFCLISLIVPQKIKNDYIEKIYEGIMSACQKYGIQVVGGNVSKGDQLIVDVFMMGDVPPADLILRKGAKAGDHVLVTGFLGEAAAGLQILKNSKLKIANEKLIAAQLVPKARTGEAQVLSGLKAVTSMMDISDGLSGDLSHLCYQSKVGVEIYEDKLPVSAELKGFAEKNNIDVLDMVLNGGEDYELLFTVPEEEVDKIVQTVRKKTGTQVSVIGKILPKNKGRKIVLRNSKKENLIPKSWNHFKNDEN